MVAIVITNNRWQFASVIQNIKAGIWHVENNNIHILKNVLVTLLMLRLFIPNRDVASGLQDSDV